MLLVASGLKIAFAGRTVLDGVDLSIDTGETVALMGPSGSGKSTLLAILGGLIEPDHGAVAYDGVQPGDISWIFQNPNLLSRRSAIDNAMLGSYRRGVTAVEARAEAERALQMVGLGQRLESPIRHLSGGERQRVGIAAALSGAPPIVLADEPTAQLDRTNGDQVTSALIELTTDRTALVVATHDPVVASACDRVLTLSDGRLADDAPDRRSHGRANDE